VAYFFGPPRITDGDPSLPWHGNKNLNIFQQDWLQLHFDVRYDGFYIKQVVNWDDKLNGVSVNCPAMTLV